MQDDSDIESYCGIPSDREGGFFDPFGLSKGKDEETLRWYRAAELKHGRVSMLATLGIVIQGYNTKIIPGFPVTDTNAIEALKKVYYEAPSALVQVRSTTIHLPHHQKCPNKTQFFCRSFLLSLPSRSFAPLWHQRGAAPETLDGIPRTSDLKLRSC
jgi:Chlorophyll A-B binding protein